MRGEREPGGSISRIRWVLTLAALAACGSPSAPFAEPDWGDFALPPPDTSLDPSRLRPGEVIASPCGFEISADWLASQDPRGWAVVDVFFGRLSPDDPLGPPTDAEVESMEAAGGHVLYRFRLPAIRTRVPTSRIFEFRASLVATGGWPVLRSVPDLGRYDYEVSVGMAPEGAAEFSALFESLGGRVESRIERWGMLFGVLPDASVPAMLDHGAYWVEPEGVGCLA